MESDHPIGSSSAQLEALRRGQDSASTEMNQPGAQMPAWGPLAHGLFGPAIVAYYRLSGSTRWLVIAALLAPFLIAGVVGTKRVRVRAQPSAKPSRERLRTARMHSFLGIGLLIATSIAASTALTAWVLVPVSFGAVAAHSFALNQFIEGAARQ